MSYDILNLNFGVTSRIVSIEVNDNLTSVQLTNIISGIFDLYISFRVFDDSYVEKLSPGDMTNYFLSKYRKVTMIQFEYEYSDELTIGRININFSGIIEIIALSIPAIFLLGQFLLEILNLKIVILEIIKLKKELAELDYAFVKSIGAYDHFFEYPSSIRRIINAIILKVYL